MNLPLLLSIINRSEPAIGGRAFGKMLAEDVRGHRRYPHRDFAKKAALLEKMKPQVAKMVDDFAREILSLIGFDENDIEAYRVAANEAFRAALPASNGSAMVH
jgi:hypothetical protein